ncbi:PilN domain-containing protein [Luteimonas suaedae]|uniref:PilN domain-containing protein n=1 Tax=Luteimonas suaedae TaxID=2605430 RepID=UPI0011EEFD04|nr:PilN domain-containing protein [Luteimonas suaedae]
MARINLLPWRAERRKQRQKEFGVMLAFAAVVGVLAWFLVNTYYNGQIEGQQARNAYLDQQIAQVDEKIKEIDELDRQRARLLARKEVIEELQASRSQMVHLFDSLVRTIPDGVMLTTLKQEGQKLTLEGRAQSNARVSTYMRNLEGSGWMTRPDLSIIEAKAADGAAFNPGLPYQFRLSVTLASPNAAAEGEEGVDGDVDSEAGEAADTTAAAEGAAS